jgi:hypothetical protein
MPFFQQLSKPAFVIRIWQYRSIASENAKESWLREVWNL